MAVSKEKSKVPAHVGIIMDGNGRWAKARGLPRTAGHSEGLKVAKAMTKAAEDLGLRYLSYFVFSTENWKRAEEEVGFLMGLIRAHLADELDFYRANGIRVVHSGAVSGLPDDIVAELREVSEATSGFDRFTVNLAINYGGRDEIARAARKLAAAGAEITEASLRSALDHPELPDPDLIIRTSSELRFSNFLLWQSAYSELFFCDKLWPDFTKDDLAAALEAYAKRDRRFGGAK
jgi:undecaprenyl diphosphate synthase